MNRRMLNLLIRFDNALDVARERMLEDLDMDAQFDGGEFSGPAHHREFECEADRLAQRFGFASADVAFDVANALGVRFNGCSATYMGETMPIPDPDDLDLEGTSDYHIGF